MGRKILLPARPYTCFFFCCPFSQLFFLSFSSLFPFPTCLPDTTLGIHSPLTTTTNSILLVFNYREDSVVRCCSYEGCCVIIGVTSVERSFLASLFELFSFLESLLYRGGMQIFYPLNVTSYWVPVELIPYVPYYDAPDLINEVYVIFFNIKSKSPFRVNRSSVRPRSSSPY